VDPTFWVAAFACLSSLGVGILQYYSSKSAAEKVKEVHDFVNNKDKVNTDTIAELRQEIRELQEDRLKRADAAPPKVIASDC
jgi:hypothetical protein